MTLEVLKEVFWDLFGTASKAPWVWGSEALVLTERF
jgi:hypothetical protein